MKEEQPFGTAVFAMIAGASFGAEQSEKRPELFGREGLPDAERELCNSFPRGRVIYGAGKRLSSAETQRGRRNDSFIQQQDQQKGARIYIFDVLGYAERAQHHRPQRLSPSQKDFQRKADRHHRGRSALGHTRGGF